MPLISSSITALADMFAQFFNWQSVSVENQAVSEIIKSKSDISKACKYAEKAFEIVERWATFKKSRPKRLFNSYLKTFRKLIK